MNIGDLPAASFEVVEAENIDANWILVATSSASCSATSSTSSCA